MSDLATALLAWHQHHGRHDLPWQRAPRTPYRIWLAEIMLQQTQVATAIPYFERFVAALPGLRELAQADEDTVLALWSGLGYYRRARHLHAAAQMCVARHGGELPRDFDALAALPGIGRSTAGAILAQAWDLPFAILDGNVRRVLARYHGVDQWPGLPAVTRRLWHLAEQHTPRHRAGHYAQAIMDLGATLCTARRPQCPRCPIAADCSARAQERTARLPVPRPRRALPQRRVHWLLLRDARGQILLERRPVSGIWPRLWSLPEAEQSPGQCAARYAHSSPARALPSIRHGFTHFQLEAQPLLFENARALPRPADGHLRWLTPEAARALALPAPVRRLLTQLPEMPR